MPALSMHHTRSHRNRCRILLILVVFFSSIAVIYVVDSIYALWLGVPILRTRQPFMFMRDGHSSSNNSLGHVARRSPVRSFQPFTYRLVPKICARRNSRSTIVVIYVASGITAEDSEWRSAVRATWAKSASASFSIAFVLGIPKRTDPFSAAYFDALDIEQLTYGDILQANFEDSFDHLIYKWWAQVYFHARYCDHVPFSTWTDSDTVVMTKNLLALLHQHGDFYAHDMGCIVMGGEPIRDPANTKYYLPFDLWPHPMLPRYCSGVFQLISTEAARRMAIAMPKLGLDYILRFGIFDVATGLVAARAGVRMITMVGIVAYPPVEDICVDSLIVVHGIRPASQTHSFWNYRTLCCNATTLANYCSLNDSAILQ